MVLPIKGNPFVKKHTQGTLAITPQFHLFSYLFIYLFNHFHHIVWNTQQKSEAPIQVCPCR